MRTVRTTVCCWVLTIAPVVMNLFGAGHNAAPTFHGGGAPGGIIPLKSLVVTDWQPLTLKSASLDELVGLQAGMVGGAL